MKTILRSLAFLLLTMSFSSYSNDPKNENHPAAGESDYVKELAQALNTSASPDAQLIYATYKRLPNHTSRVLFVQHLSLRHIMKLNAAHVQWMLDHNEYTPNQQSFLQATVKELLDISNSEQELSLPELRKRVEPTKYRFNELFSASEVSDLTSAFGISMIVEKARNANATQ